MCLAVKTRHRAVEGGEKEVSIYIQWGGMCVCVCVFGSENTRHREVEGGKRGEYIHTVGWHVCVCVWQ